MPNLKNTYVLDSHPLLKYFKQEAGWEKVRSLFQEALEHHTRLTLSLINWGEVYYSIVSDVGHEKAEFIERVIDTLPIEVVTPDRDMTRQAAMFKSLGGISYADCFAAALAVKEKATLVTGDPEFKKLEKLGHIKVLWI